MHSSFSKHGRQSSASHNQIEVSYDPTSASYTSPDFESRLGRPLNCPLKSEKKVQTWIVLIIQSQVQGLDILDY